MFPYIDLLLELWPTNASTSRASPPPPPPLERGMTNGELHQGQYEKRTTGTSAFSNVKTYICAIINS